MIKHDQDQVMLAHISDIHLPTPKGIPVQRLLNKRFLSLLSWHFSRRKHHLKQLSKRVIEDIHERNPDMILNTGDLTNLGDRLEYAAGQDWMRALPVPARFVPGNHDLLVKDSWENGLPAMASWMEGSYTQFPFVTRTNFVAIIGLNSALPTPAFQAWGRVDAAQCAQLGDVLRQTRGLFRVVMIHHPPRYGTVKPRKALKNIDQIASILRENGAELVLHGHAHNEALQMVEGCTIPLLGVASASLDCGKPWRRASWNEITIRNEYNGWSLTMTQRRMAEAGGITYGLNHRQFIAKPTP